MEKLKGKAAPKPPSIEELAERGCAALIAQGQLKEDETDTEAWNAYAKVIRATLRALAEIPARKESEALAKARLLALVTEPEGDVDHRFALAESLLDDIEALDAARKSEAKKEKVGGHRG